MTSDKYRLCTMAAVGELGIVIPDTLPSLEPNLELRGIDTIAARMLCLYVTVGVVYGFDRSKAIAWLDAEHLVDSLSEKERLFVFKHKGEPVEFELHIEAMWALGWVVGKVTKLDFARACDDNFAEIFPKVKSGESSARFREQMKLRSLDDVIAQCDMAYCLHWALTQWELSGRHGELKMDPVAVVERRWALEWALSDVDWDEVSLDT